MNRRNIKIKARIFCSKVISAVALAMTLLLLPLAQAQPAQPVASTPDEVFRIVVAERVGDKEGRDNRLMLETLGYIPVYMTGNFGGHDGTVFLGSYPTEIEAHRVRQQLIRDGFAPGKVVRVPRNHTLGTGFFSVYVATYFDEACAMQDEEKLRKAYSHSVNILGDQQSGHQSLFVGLFLPMSEARAIEARLRAHLGYPHAQIVSSFNGKPVALNLISPSPEWKAKTADEIRRSSQRELSDIEVEEITALVSSNQRNSAEERSSVTEEIERLNQQLRDLKRPSCGVTMEIPLTEEAKRTAEQRRKISQLFRESNELVKSGRNEEALVKLREILALDPENQVAMARAQVVSTLHNCQVVSSSVEDNYAAIKQYAIKAENDGTVLELIRALEHWKQIASLHERYKSEAEAKIADLTRRIEALAREEESKPR